MTTTPQRVIGLINGIIEREGGYVDHPDDRGGPTMHGITQATAREHGWTRPIHQLPTGVAFNIYLDDYYRGPRFDRVAARDPDLAAELTDTGVNMGQTVPVTFLQRCLRVLNLKGTLYADIAADGYIGRRTLDALDAYLAHRGDEGAMVLRRAVDDLQAARYIDLAEGREANESFVYGWLLNRTGDTA